MFFAHNSLQIDESFGLKRIKRWMRYSMGFSGRRDKERGLSGESMLPCLGYTCRVLRDKRGLSVVDVAREAEKDQAAITRFEAGLSWPRNIDSVIQCYAQLADMQPASIWLEAAMSLSGKPSDEQELRQEQESLREALNDQQAQLKELQQLVQRLIEQYELLRDA